MKLNLLPTYVGKEKAVKSAVFLSVIIAAAGIGAAAFMIISSRDAVKTAKEAAVDAQAAASRAVAESKKGDLILANARVLILNTNLAEAMNKHNSAYPNLYNTVRRYIPSYFRLTSMSATPAGEQAVVTLQGVIQTQQQYADLMLALLRIPGASSVTRSGYNPVDKFVPSLSEGFQRAVPIRPDEEPVPDDPLARMDQLIAQGRVDRYLGVGGFGDDNANVAKGAMPDWSAITVSVVVPGNIQTPNPRATLATVGAAPAPGTGGGGTGTQPAGGPPTGAGGPPPGAGGPGPIPGRGGDVGDR
jgi:hypothetical protein